MHSRSDNTTFTSYNDADGVVDELFESLQSRYQVSLETSMTQKINVFNMQQRNCCIEL